MKKIIPVVLALLVCGLANAQDKGKLVYERTSQIQIRLSDDHSGLEQQLPKTRTDKFELMFADNKTLWKAAEAENDNETISGPEGGMQIRMVVAGNDDVLFTDLSSGKRVEKREMFDKNFIIDDSVRPLKWKMTGETREILGKKCMKATSTDIRTRTMMNMDNGKTERKEIQDTSHIIAWFTTDIPVSAGPAEFQGQLPGLILEMDVANGRQTFKAVAFSPDVEVKEIKAPEGKKRYTAEEFRAEREKMLNEMQQNNRGGNRVIRMN